MHDELPTDDLPNGWGPRLADLQARKQRSRAQGGDEKIAKQHARGSLTARERIEYLCDPGSFRELGPLVGGDIPSDAFVCGWARIDGRPVVVGCEDFTVLGGSIGSGSTAKRYRMGEIALAERCPHVLILDGAGHRPAMPGDAPHMRAPTDLIVQAHLSGRVPSVTAVLGASAGHSAMAVPVADWTVMAANSAVFTAGPPLVKEALGEVIDKHALGGPQVAVRAGTVHNVASDDKAALDLIREYLSYFPSSAHAYPHRRIQGLDLGPRLVPELLDIIPVDGRTLYDMRHVVSAIVDEGTFFQVQPDFGETMVCALARIGGEPVGIVANQPAVKGGAIDADGAAKGARFVEVCDSFHVPLVFLGDNPGVMAGSEAEMSSILRNGGRMFAAQMRTTTIKFHVTLRKAYGFGGCIMGFLGFTGNSRSYAFPGATMGAMPAKGSSKATHADQDTAALLAQAELESSFKSAQGLSFDDLIDPRELRNLLLEGLHFALGRRSADPQPVARVGILP
jgi:acetyl-CoA carboxylase carboxyltransferase component